MWDNLHASPDHRRFRPISRNLNPTSLEIGFETTEPQTDRKLRPVGGPFTSDVVLVDGICPCDGWRLLVVRGDERFSSLVVLMVTTRRTRTNASGPFGGRGEYLMKPFQ